MDARVEMLLPDLCADGWRAMYEADPDATPYMSPAWGSAWWRHFGAGSEPLAVTVRHEGRLVAFAPLVIRRRGPLRVLRPLGKEPADYWDVLAVPEFRVPAVAAVVDAVRREGRRWDVLVLDALREGSGTEQAIRTGLSVIGPDRSIACPGMPLPATWDEYLASLPSKRRNYVRRRLRRLDDGELTLRTVHDAGDVAATLQRWQDMRERQWQAAGKSLDPAHREPRFREFLTDVAIALIPSGEALLWEVRHEDRPAGVFLNLADRRSFYWYLGAYEPELASLAIGKAVIGYAIRSSIEAGRSYFDFTVGDERYKYEYGATDRRTPHIVAGTREPRSLAALAAVGLRARARRLAQDRGAVIRGAGGAWRRVPRPARRVPGRGAGPVGDSAG